MMTHAGFDDHFKRKFWCEAVSTATKLDNMIVRNMGGKPPYYMFYKEHPKYRKHLRIFGEIAVVANHERKSMRTKIECRGKVAMFVGYAEDHAGDVYRFIHLKTQHVLLSRDARWMNIMWKTYMRMQEHINHGLQIIDEDFESDDEEEIRENWVYQQPEEEEHRRLGLDIDMIGAREENLGSTRSQTLEMRSPSNHAMERANINMDNWIQETCYNISAVTSGPDEPNNFNEAWNHQNHNEQRKWRDAITKELYCMENKKVWKIKYKTDIPNNRRLIGCIWVFKIERDGTYRARLVALGYSQVPHVDFTNNFAPVVNDVTFRIALARMMLEDLKCMMDVETAFLYGEIEEENIYGGTGGNERSFLKFR